MVRATVLDRGYVELLDTFGNDLEVANDARASFKKRSYELTDSDVRLIQFLGREGHESPFRMQLMKFEVKAPLFVARQWWKYKVASQHVEECDGWNEESRRYVTSEPEFHVPDQFHAGPENKKQGSGEPVSAALNDVFRAELKAHQAAGERLYQRAMDEGICAEEARLFLPAYGLYVTWRWLASLQSVRHFVQQRTEEAAQRAIREYAAVIDQMAKAAFPHAWGWVR